MVRRRVNLPTLPETRSKASMDVSATSFFGTISSVDEFALEVAANRKATYDTLLHRGRPVTDVEARIVEAQFRLPDGSTLVFLNDDQPFKEVLTLVLVDAGLRVLDRLQLGGAFTPGYLTYAYPIGPEQVAFCWHDLDQVVTIRRYRRVFGLRSGWLAVREVAVQAPKPAAVVTPRPDDPTPAPRASNGARPRQRRRRGQAIPALIWLAWLRLRTVRFGRNTGFKKTSVREPGAHDHEPRQ